MKLLNAISKSAITIFVAIVLLSSEKMKDRDVIAVQIDWVNGSSHGKLSFDGAIYPEEFDELPVLAVPVENHSFDHFEVINMDLSEIDSSNLEFMRDRIPEDFKIVSVKNMWDRGKEVSVLTIFPFAFDSIRMIYQKIDYLEIKPVRNNPGLKKSGLRKSSGDINSVLSEGTWYKLPVVEHGIYKIDYDYLKNAGLDPLSVNPKNIKIYGNGGGMLPQKNDADRPVDLSENAISVIGSSDGRFDRGDYVLFYGQGPDHQRLLKNGFLEYQKNYYSDTSFYFLTVSGEEGLRIRDRENLGPEHPRIKHFDDFIIYEKDKINIINSGREWYGEKFDFTTTYDFKFDFPELISNSNLTITSSIMGQSYEDASVDLFVNGTSLGQQPVHSIVEGSYLAKGSNQVDEFQINTSNIPDAEKFTIRMSFNPNGTKLSKAYLNYLKVLGKRNLKLYESQTSFRSIESTNHAISTFHVRGGGSAYQVWDVTDPLKPYNQKFSSDGDDAVFGAFSSELVEFIIFEDQHYLVPGKAGKIHNQNLHGARNVDLLIITHPLFIDEAKRLADLRRSHDGLDILVVTTEEIYNEFSSGKPDVTAIRDFIKYIYDLGTGDDRLQNVLLFGKGSFDYKDRTENNTNLVPIYTSRNSLHPINSYSSDDYYGFLDNDEGAWGESYSGDHLMDIGVGRLPIKSIEEAKVAVDKLINYASNEATFGPWRNEIFFIADDGDGNLHQRDADRLANMVDTSFAQFNVNKIYVDAFRQIESSIGESAPEVNAELQRSIERGGLIFNFTGHGSATRWTSETILNISSAVEYENFNTLPLFVTATCEFGRHDNPKAISGAEYLLLNPKGGAIGLVTTSRPVFSSTNFILNKAFYQNVFKKEEGKYKTLGEVFRKTKNNSLNGNINRNFSLLGDPSMTLAYPVNDIILMADEGVYKPGDTLNALSTVKLKGQVLDINGVVNTGFNGSLFAKVFEKPSEIVTYGHEDAPMKFLVRDNVVFNGEVSVLNGEFYIEFIVPKNITFDFETGKISLYAVDKLQKSDANGANLEFVIGGENEDFIPDNTPPVIRLFINDTTFVSKGITRPDILFIGKLSDESGISTAKSEAGQELMMHLDDSLEVALRNYFISEKDTYKSGWVTYPIKELSIGNHKIRLQAWDVHNNSSSAEIEFVVIEDEYLAIEKLLNFPNPFSDFTTFSFEHNRAGDDLEILIEVFSTQGKLVKQMSFIRTNSESRISDIVWDGKEQNGSNLSGGIYIFRLSIRSLVDGSKKHANQKLVIIN